MLDAHHSGASPRPVIAIIGGGLSGAAVAYQLSVMIPAGAANIVVLEPRAELGADLPTQPITRSIG